MGFLYQLRDLDGSLITELIIRKIKNSKILVFWEELSNKFNILDLMVSQIKCWMCLALVEMTLNHVVDLLIFLDFSLNDCFGAWF